MCLLARVRVWQKCKCWTSIPSHYTYLSIIISYLLLKCKRSPSSQSCLPSLRYSVLTLGPDSTESTYLQLKSPIVIFEDYTPAVLYVLVGLGTTAVRKWTSHCWLFTFYLSPTRVSSHPAKENNHGCSFSSSFFADRCPKAANRIIGSWTENVTSSTLIDKFRCVVHRRQNVCECTPVHR